MRQKTITSELGILRKDMIEQYILPHLSIGNRGPKPLIPVYQIVIWFFTAWSQGVNGVKSRFDTLPPKQLLAGKRSIIISENGPRMDLGKKAGQIYWQAIELNWICPEYNWTEVIRQLKKEVRL